MKLVLCGNFGAGNTGDEAILQAIEEMVDGHEVTVMRGGALNNLKRKISSIDFIPSGPGSLFRGIISGKLWQTLRAIRECDAFLLGGGGLFTDENPKAVIIWFMQALYPILKRKKLLCIGQSVGPLKRAWAVRMTRWVFRHATLSTVRDHASAELLKSWKIPNVHEFADVVFGLSPQMVSHTADTGIMEHNAASSGISRTQASPRTRSILLSLRHWPHPDKNVLQEIASFIDWLYEKHQLNTIFVPFQAYQAFDSDIYKELKKLVQHPENLLEQVYTENIEQISASMNEAELVVGMRLHSLILASLAHKPFMAISYSQKVSEVVKSLGIEKYLIDWKDFSAEKAKQIFDQLWGVRDQETVHLKAAVEKMQKLARDHAELVVKSLL